MVKKVVIITLVVIGILAVTGGVIYFATRKSSSHPPPPVKKCDPKCKSGFVCHDGKCLPTGKCDPPCRHGYQCVESKCQPIGNCNPPCTSGYVCQNGHCIPSGTGKCVNNTDCKSGQTCVNPGEPNSFCANCMQPNDPVCDGGICVNPGQYNSFCTQCGTASNCTDSPTNNAYILRSKTPDFPSADSGGPLLGLSVKDAITRCNNIVGCSGFTMSGPKTQLKSMTWDPMGLPPNPNDLVDTLAIKRISHACKNPKQQDSQCVQCLENGDCPTSERPVCDPTTNFCYQCLANGDCQSDTGKTMCQDKVCAPDPCLPHGVGTANGPNVTCSCATGWKGNRCQYSDTTTCDGHGTVNDDGACTCTAAGWKGDHCNVPENTTAYLAHKPACNMYPGSYFGPCQWTPGSSPRYAGTCDAGQPPGDNCCYVGTGGDDRYCGEVITTNTDSSNCYNGHELVNCHLDKGSADAQAKSMCQCFG
jgi:hypothetical protein